ncbi:hypothetical protein OG799_12770 [Micromonospora sp. NBC_00898]|uniref:hypothetical protein n=1 Tax=Micromonospora sp. NBC_00898 TaxID=2975981 RepID=UPI00386FD45F|nr:hypothetical protein OG799_12770 [Micromonospora sp. NBC_00898]
MTRRGERLTRLALRLGLLLAGVTGAWSAYDAVTGHAAYAADPAPAVTVTDPVTMLRDALSAVLPTTPTTGPTAPRTGTGGAQPDPAPPPTASTRPAPRTSDHRTAPDAPRRTTRDAPPRRVTRHAPPHRRPAARSARPGLPPDRATRAPSRSGEPSRIGPAEPGAGILDPVAAGVVAPVAAGLRPAPSAGATKQPAATARHGSPPRAGGTPHRTTHPLRSHADHLPVPPVPSPSSASSAGAPHGDAADTPPAAWAPPAVRGQPSRPAGPAALSSRSPRPGTRPA